MLAHRQSHRARIVGVVHVYKGLFCPQIVSLINSYHLLVHPQVLFSTSLQGLSNNAFGVCRLRHPA
jgi:hypothetical protein